MPSRLNTLIAAGTIMLGPVLAAMPASAAAQPLVLSYSTTSHGTEGQGTSVGVPVPSSYTYGNTFVGEGFDTISGTSYQFYDDYVFTVSNAFASSITATIDLGSAWSIGDLQVRLYDRTLQTETPQVLGDPLGTVWSGVLTSLPGGGSISVLEAILLDAGTYALQIRGNITGEFGGSYSGVLNVAEVPVPAAFWLFGSALSALLVARRQHAV